MKLLARTMIVSALAFASQISAAQVIPAESMRVTLDYLLKNRTSLVAGPPATCAGHSCQNIPLTVREIQRKGKPVGCVVIAQDISISDPGLDPNPDSNKYHTTLVSWTFTVQRTVPSTAQYAFPKFSGVAIIQDDAHQTGGKGDAHSNDQEAQLTHHYNKQGDRVGFFPVVIQTIPAPPGNPTAPATTRMCAATDPWMNNN